MHATLHKYLPNQFQLLDHTAHFSFLRRDRTGPQCLISPDKGSTKCNTVCCHCTSSLLLLQRQNQIHLGTTNSSACTILSTLHNNLHHGHEQERSKFIIVSTLFISQHHKWLQNQNPRWWKATQKRYVTYSTVFFQPWRQ